MRTKTHTRTQTHTHRWHSMIFGSPMVKALIATGARDVRPDGITAIKKLTRRIIDPQPIDNTEVDGNFFSGDYSGYVKVDNHPNWREQFTYQFCKYKVGDLIWVRENIRAHERPDGTDGVLYSDGMFIPIQSTQEAADAWLKLAYYGKKGKKFRHVPSIHMPRWASRLTLEVAGEPRLERLQEISEDDAVDEGIMCRNEATGGDDFQDYYFDYSKNTEDETDFPWIAGDARKSFETLWAKIHSQESWNSNPWVWVIPISLKKTVPVTVTLLKN